MAKNLPEVVQPAPKPLSEQGFAVLSAIDEMQAQLAEQREIAQQLERANLMLESENNTLKMQLEQERSERKHYHSLANELITRLDVVMQTIDDVVKRADQEVYRQRKENPRADLPELKIPEFLKGLGAAKEGNGAGQGLPT